MGYINVDIDIEDIIENISREDLIKVIGKIQDEELLVELKRRNLLNKVVDTNRFTLESNYYKREYLTNILDLTSYSSDADILNAVIENIR